MRFVVRVCGMADLMLPGGNSAAFYSKVRYSGT